MNKRKLILGLGSGLVFASIASGVLASVAWFYISNNVDVGVTGSFIKDYFHCGDGTQNDPFVITRPIHYYHMVEFYQRLTTLPLSEQYKPEFGTDYLYFQVGYNIDGSQDGSLEVYDYDNQGLTDESTTNILNMAYYSGSNALLPIGTNEVPFIGNFDGKADRGIVISNLNIHCSEYVELDNGTRVQRKASDIGVFGYVSDDDENSHATIIKNTKINGLTIDLSDVPNSVEDNITDIDHLEDHDGAHVGYIAGHIHRYTNAGLTDASPLSHVYVDNATVKGGAGVTSKFGYIGLVDYLDGVAPLEIDDEISALNETATGQGEEDEWGGSINSKTYTNLFYSLDHSSTSERTTTVSGEGGYVVKRTASAITDPNSSQVVYRLRDGSYVPFKFTNENHTQAALTNTGYLVGSNIGTGANASPKVSSYKMVNLQNALTNDRSTSMATAYGSANIAYTDSKLEILTYQNGWKRIKDSHNSSNNSTNAAITSYTKTDLATFGFQKYEESRNSLQEVLESSPFIHGIHFDNNAISTSSLLTVSANIIRVNGQKVTTSYQLPKGSLDFNLKEEGIINFFAGTYNSSQVNLNFFSLYQVTRNNSGNITALTQIKKIYANPSGGYLYQTGNSAPSGAGSLLFDVETILHGNAPVINMMYYFEVPVNAGEYAMGVAGSTQGAYMIYLDLAANGGVEEDPTFDQDHLIRDTYLFTQIGFLKSSGSFFVNSCFNVAYAIPDGADKDNFSITIYCNTATFEDEEGEEYEGVCYEIVIKNTIHDENNQSIDGSFSLDALLIDNDTEPDNLYPYMYAITYNEDIERQLDGNNPDPPARIEYYQSNTFDGLGNGKTMTPRHNIRQEEENGD